MDTISFYLTVNWQVMSGNGEQNAVQVFFVLPKCVLRGDIL